MEKYQEIDFGKIVPTNEGKWNAEKPYPVFAWVTHNGDGWISTMANIGEEPSAETSVWFQATDVQVLVEAIKKATEDAETLNGQMSEEEKKRAAAEILRGKAEEARAEAERLRNEGEKERKEKETARQESEDERGRQEEARQEGERQRNLKFTQEQTDREQRYVKEEVQRNLTFQEGERQRNAAEEQRNRQERERQAEEDKRKASFTTNKELTEQAILNANNAAGEAERKATEAQEAAALANRTAEDVAREFKENENERERIFQSKEAERDKTLQDIDDAAKEATKVAQKVSDLELKSNEIASNIGASVEYDDSKLPTLCGQPMKLFGEGTPQESIVPTNWVQFLDGGYNWDGTPTAEGQEYINITATANGRYTAVKDGEFGLKWVNF